MNFLLLALVVAAFLLIEALIGGTRLLFSLPSYCLLAVAACLGTKASWKPVMPAKASCLVAITLFSGYLLVRIAFSPVEFLARADLYSLVGALMVFLLFALVLTAPKHRIVFLYALLALVLAQVLIGVVQFTRGDNFMPFPFLQRADYGFRASGLYICPNHLAGLLEVVLVFAVSFVCWSRRSVGVKVVCAYVALVALGGLLITGSRGGYFSILAGLGAFIVLSLMAARRARVEKLWLRVLIGALLLALLGGGVAWFASHQPRVQTRMAGMLETGNPRLAAWSAAIEQAKLAPMFGTGAGTFLYYGRKFRSERIVHDFIDVHNDYLHLLAEYGAAGVAAFAFFFGAHLAAGWRAFRWQISDRALALGRVQSDSLALNIGALCAVATYVVHSVVDFNLHIPGNALLMAYVFAILANPGVEAPNQPRHEFFSRAGQVALPLLGIFTLAVGARLLPGEYYTEKARVALRDGEPFLAVHHGKAALEWEQKNPELWSHMGEAARLIAQNALTPQTQSEYWELGEHALTQSLIHFPHDRRALLLMAYLLDDKGDFAGSDVFLRRALEWDPNSIQLRRYYEWWQENRNNAHNPDESIEQPTQADSEVSEARWRRGPAIDCDKFAFWNFSACQTPAFTEQMRTSVADFTRQPEPSQQVLTYEI